MRRKYKENRPLWDLRGKRGSKIIGFEVRMVVSVAAATRAISNLFSPRYDTGVRVVSGRRFNGLYDERAAG